jgi:hypothetical protein
MKPYLKNNYSYSRDFLWTHLSHLKESHERNDHICSEHVQKQNAAFFKKYNPNPAPSCTVNNVCHTVRNVQSFKQSGKYKSITRRKIDH